MHSIFDSQLFPGPPCCRCDSILPCWGAFRHSAINGWTPRSYASFASPLARKRTSGNQSRLAATRDYPPSLRSPWRAAVANTAKPDTIMGWYRRLVARKFDGSKSRRYPGRPRIDDEIEQWVLRMAKENSDWGYERIVGAMANLGYRLSDQTVGNILQRHGIPPAPERKRTTTWTDFIPWHL